MNGTELCVHHLVEQQVRRAPRRTAIEHETGRFTYVQLDSWAEHLARRLRSLGVGPDVVVGLLADSSPATIAAMLGILKAGGAYLPMDHRHPEERLRHILADAGAAVLVAPGDLATPFGLPVLTLRPEPPPPGDPVASPRPASQPDDLAYILFTSGSTGRPKGVAMPHRGLVNGLRVQLDRYPEPARTLQFAPLGFDISFQEIFYTLSCGGTLVLIAPDTRRDSRRLARSLLDAGVERIFMPFVALNELAVACADLPVKPPLREVFTAGEALRVTPAIEALLADTAAGFENQYGPTETHFTTRERLTGPPSTWPRLPAIGLPPPGVEALVLDAELVAVPAGEPGELYVGGVGLARGYANRPALTAERFIPHPFPRRPGERLYATGDLVRALPDGRLEFLGRADDQVKIRGQRVELGEIEHVLALHPAVAQSAVVVKAGDEGWHRLIAYIVPGSRTPSASELRAHLAGQLPEVMLPAAYRLVERLPRTSSGKLDRRSLAASPGLPLPGESTRVPPRTHVERGLCEIYAEVLGEPVDTVASTFIDLGGDSLAAARVAARVRARMGADIDTVAVLRAASIVELATQVSASIGAPGAVAATQPPPPRPQSLPLSSAQRRFWLFDRLNPGNPAYNISWSLALAGPLDDGALRRALAELVRRHEVLRTVFELVGDEPVQVVRDDVVIALGHLDLSHLAAGDQAWALARLAQDDRDRAFDLRTAPLLRMRLVRLGPDRRRLLVTVHHIVVDRWALDLLANELRALLAAYSAGQPSPLAEPPLQYADHALLERRQLTDAALAPSLAQWARLLDGLPMALDLPVDRPRLAQPTLDSGTVEVNLDGAVTAGVVRLARQLAVTPYAVLLTAFGVLLSRLAGQPDLCVASPTSGRDRLEHEQMLGCFINTLPLRVDLRDRPTFSDAVRHVQATVLTAMAHRSVPFETLVERLQLPRDPLRPPLSQVMFVFDGVESADADPAPSATAEQGTGVYDLTLLLRFVEDNLTGALLYRRELFDHERVVALVGHLEVLLRAAVSEPDARVTGLPLLSAAERRRVVEQWNATERPFPAQGVHELFAVRAGAQPDAPALLASDRSMTYDQLNRRSQAIAARLHELGLTPERIVAVCTRDGFELVAAMLGILTAGGAFLLVDPTYPRDRIAYMLDDASPPLALADRGLLDGVVPASCRVIPLDEPIPAPPGGPPAVAVHPDTLAYVVYTSGSTGRPKGTQVAHGGLTNLAEEKRRWLGITPGSRVARFASPSFDAAIAEVFQTLTAGATLVISARGRTMPGPEFTKGCRDAGVTHLTMPPSVLALLDPAELPTLATVMSAGEACTANVARQWLDHGRRLLNCYGPTEATVATTVGICDPSDLPPPIGQPIANLRVYIVDRELQLVPPGFVGELAIGGVGVARGYLHQSALTARRFVPDPFSGDPGARLYLTGDLASLRRDGSIVYHGRADAQVKIRGVRVELGEIEATLTRHPLVKECAVVLRAGPGGDPRIVACVVLTTPGTGVDELRSAARAFLPPQMVPSAFAVLDRLPLTSHGKVDRSQLVGSTVDDGSAVEALPVATPVQQAVVGAWSAVLGSERPIGRNTNFFDHGGHSLMVLTVVRRLRDDLGIEVPMHALFEAPVLEAFAHIVERLADPAAGD